MRVRGLANQRSYARTDTFLQPIVNFVVEQNWRKSGSFTDHKYCSRPAVELAISVRYAQVAAGGRGRAYCMAARGFRI